jgi:hypothetical protein
MTHNIFESRTTAQGTLSPAHWSDFAAPTTENTALPTP